MGDCSNCRYRSGGGARNLQEFVVRFGVVASMTLKDRETCRFLARPTAMLRCRPVGKTTSCFLAGRQRDRLRPRQPYRVTTLAPLSFRLGSILPGWVLLKKVK